MPLMRSLVDLHYIKKSLCGGGYCYQQSGPNQIKAGEWDEEREMKSRIRVSRYLKVTFIVLYLFISATVTLTLCLSQAVESQIRSFGQTPCQLLIEPHPPRSSAMQVLVCPFTPFCLSLPNFPSSCFSSTFFVLSPTITLFASTLPRSLLMMAVMDSTTPLMFTEQMQQDVIMVLKFPSNSPVTHVAANTQSGLTNSAVITVTANRLFAVNKWHGLTGHQSASVQDQQYQLPVEIDNLIASNVGIHRRQISDLLDQSIQVNAQCFVITADNRFILLCGFWDKSFRIYSTDTGNRNDPSPHWCLQRNCLHHSTQRKGSKVTNEPADCITTSSPRGSDSFLISRTDRDSISWEAEAQNASKLTQIVFGHLDVVTCLARSESYIGGDCYVLSGSRDATLLLWYWNGKHSSIGENPGKFVTPRAILTGHDCEVTCASVCAELGLVISGCREGPCLVHSMNGDLLRTLEGPDGCVRPRLVLSSTEGHCVIYYDKGHFCVFSINGKLLGHMEVEDNIKTLCFIMSAVWSVIKCWHDLPMGLLLSSLHLSFFWLLNPKGPELSFDLQGYKMPLNLHISESRQPSWRILEGRPWRRALIYDSDPARSTTWTSLLLTDPFPDLVQRDHRYHRYSGLRNKLFARSAPCMLGKKGACAAFDWMRQPLAGHAHSKAMLLSKDGQYLLSGGDAGVLSVWQIHDLKQLFTYPGCDAGIRSMAMSHDQRCIITGMASGSIVLFYNDFNRWHHEYQTRY
ncbi:Lipopolysaccharide-responsive and beige-like anchor protein [Labeo rohita]|uniref:Lipopolysaccharide-responsive and beige-like anchor protein n=1 Tax=Labeo rohita TaxID=84645 RepID=A0ABQ8N0S2_LABRO|nr:Lipopolysaccharide-responsive and beige-like anchor protein [Labeo rohita]